MDKSQLSELLENTFPFWEKLTDNDKNLLLGATRSMNFERGSNVHNGFECTGIIVVKTGSLRLYMLSDEGKEVTLYRLYPGDTCMLSASCVISAITFDVYIDSEENSECFVIQSHAYDEISQRVPEAKIFALEIVVNRFSDVMWVMQQILFMSMDKRLAIFLLDEANKTKSDTIRLTHEQIAKYIGSAREVITRMLKYFVTEGIIETSRSEGIKIIDKQKLKKLAL